MITIFVNHVPGTTLENFTSRNFGFSDAAEAFVLMSGIAAACAYFRAIGEAFAKSSARAFKLYWVHLLITALAIISVVGISSAVGIDVMLDRNNMEVVFSAPAAATLGIITLGHQLGYFNILPLYCVLILAAPLMIAAALYSRTVFLSGSGLLWLLAGATHTNFPNFPTDGGWFLNPLSWQFLFSIGVVIGVSMKEGRQFCSYHPLAFALAATYLIFACIVVQSSLWEYIAFPAVPEILLGFNKMHLTLPRLAHVLALAYVVIHMHSIAAFANARWSSPLRFLGSNSLAVFATGSVLCIALQTVRNAYPSNDLGDIVILSAGLGVQFMAAGWDTISKTIRQTTTSFRFA